jgi:hypothetical protein
MDHDMYHWQLICFVQATHSCACVVNVRACLHSLIFLRILSKFSWVLFLFMHRVHTCEVTCARASAKHLLIFGWILFRFPGNMLQITRTCHVHAPSACVQARMYELAHA